jgi:CheY-like chemotaxis protein
MHAVARPRVFIVDDERPYGRVLARPDGLGKGRFEIVWDFPCPICEGHGCKLCTDEQGRVTGRAPYGQYPRIALERLCTDELFDIIFLDIVMPDLNGMSFFKNLELRAPARCKRVVIVTGGGQIPAVEDFIAKHHTIEKPASLTVLEACVEVYAEKTCSRGPR